MLVYGDRSHPLAACEQACHVAVAWRRAAQAPPGLARHAWLVEALIEAGGWLQGVADGDLRLRGHDERSGAQELGARLVQALAHAVWRSWNAGFGTELESELGELGPVLRTQPATGLQVRRPEGYAFYALYPEGHAAAAQASRLPPATRVIGLRSIGASLAAMVAAGLGAGPIATLRPVGHPFARRIEPGPALAAHLADPVPPELAIVDEGPGLSGSSFGAVADWLEARGRPPSRMVAFPGHAGDLGPQAGVAHRRRWATLRRPLVTLDTLVIGASRPEHRLGTWVADRVGPLAGPLEEVSGGGWRAVSGFPSQAWPPVQAEQERRKFLARTQGARYLVRFAGLGAEGRLKQAMAGALAGAGFGAPVAGLCHGFLVERWLDETQPLDLANHCQDDLARQVGRYLGFRARTFTRAFARPAGEPPCPCGDGASLAELMAMARHNTTQGLGAFAAAKLDRWTPARRDALSRLAVPVAVDGRLQAWEWRVTPDGRLLKTDAVDHQAGHDLVGWQDIAWDLAGAGVELRLGPAARATLLEETQQGAARRLSRALRDLLEPCYLAFQLGTWSMSAGAAGDQQDAARIAARVDRLAATLDRLLAGGPG